MILNNLNDKEKLYRIIINELKFCGIKFRRDKNVKSARVPTSNTIFSVSLDLLELTEVNIHGGTVEIPTFVCDACTFVTANINTEGLFRKSGSAARQKQIKTSLENGIKLGKQHNVIDVANILKSFFRDLPEAMIPPGYAQDSMLKCLITTEKIIDNLLLTCLLLPPLTLCTLAYFMQFLKKISEYSSTNKMTIENLSIIFAPSLMPLNQITEERLNGHVKVICLLIENATEIGIIPEHLQAKLNILSDDNACKQTTNTKPKRKIRRSGSLSRMLNGLRKIVGGVGSNEHLNNVSPESSIKPCINKSAKKRALETPVFSAKKKKNILAMQKQSDSLGSSTPLIKKAKLRLSLEVNGINVGNRLNIQKNSNQTTRRWSFVGSPRNLNHTKSTASPISCTNKMELDINRSFSNEITTVRPIQTVRLRATSLSTCNVDNGPQIITEFSNFPVEEYIEIKERVDSLEKIICEEFKCLSNYESICPENDSMNASGPEKVQNKFEQILEKTETLNENSISGQLAHHLKHELRIRSKNEPVIIRSPSARKIGTIRRRSRELTVSAASRYSNNMKQKVIFCDDNKITKTSTNPKISLRRGKPNTVTTGLTYTLPIVKDTQISAANSNCIIENANCSQNTPKYRHSLMNVQLKNCTKLASSPLMTVMKKPKSEISTLTDSVPSNKKSKIISLPKPTMRSSLLTKNFNLQLNGSDFEHSTNLLPEQTGRASIARIRVQNTGMVMEKAKLFNGMSKNAKF